MTMYRVFNGPLGANELFTRDGSLIEAECVEDVPARMIDRDWNVGGDEGRLFFLLNEETNMGTLVRITAFEPEVEYIR